VQTAGANAFGAANGAVICGWLARAGLAGHDLAGEQRHAMTRSAMTLQGTRNRPLSVLILHRRSWCRACVGSGSTVGQTQHASPNHAHLRRIMRTSAYASPHHTHPRIRIPAHASPHTHPLRLNTHTRIPIPNPNLLVYAHTLRWLSAAISSTLRVSTSPVAYSTFAVRARWFRETTSALYHIPSSGQ
jgi:hypothetical protein